MKLTIAFELPEDFTKEERETFREDIGAAAVASIKNVYEYRGRELAEEVAASMKVEEKQ